MIVSRSGSASIFVVANTERRPLASRRAERHHSEGPPGYEGSAAGPSREVPRAAKRRRRRFAIIWRALIWRSSPPVWAGARRTGSETVVARGRREMGI